MFAVALGLILMMALGSVTPGLMGQGAQQVLQYRLTGVQQPQVSVVADPFLDLPRGRIPTVVANLDGLEVAPGLAIPNLEVTVTGLWVPPAALVGFHRFELLAPAAVSVRAGASEAQLQAMVAGLVDDGQFEALNLGPLGSPVDLKDVRVTLTPGRVGMTATAERRGRAPLAVAVSFAPVVSADGRQLELTEPQVQVGTKEWPAGLARLMLAASAPKLTLDDLKLPGDGWRITGLTVDAWGLSVRAAGMLNALAR